MALKHVRTTTEFVPATNSLKSDDNNGSNAVVQVLVDEDRSAFTVEKWRNKIFTDPRVRSKVKDKNYKVKVVEDVEMTRQAAIKTLQQKGDFRLSEIPISVGQEAITFEGTYKSNNNQKVIAKIFNGPVKLLAESNPEILECEPDFSNELQKAESSKLQHLWAEREFSYSKMWQDAQIGCLSPLFCVKNVVVMTGKIESLSEHLPVAPNKIKHLHRIYGSIVRTLKELYKLGYVPIHLDETRLCIMGTLLDAGKVIRKSHPKAASSLFKLSQIITNFIQMNGEGEIDETRCPGAQSMFAEVTGFEYVPEKIRPSTTIAAQQQELRKSERKSARSLDTKKERKSQP